MTLEGEARRPVAVIALGGNALLPPQDDGTQEERFPLAWKTTRWLEVLTVSRAKEMLGHNQFPAGSMGPKIRAAIAFVERTGKEVLITDADGKEG